MQSFANTVVTNLKNNKKPIWAFLFCNFVKNILLQKIFLFMAICKNLSKFYKSVYTNCFDINLIYCNLVVMGV